VSFVSPLVGIPFLLDLMRLPNDVFQLFVVSSIYTDRVRVALGGMHLFVFTVVAIAALHGTLQVRWRAGAAYAAAAVALVVVSVFGVRTVLGRTMRGTYTKDKVIANMQLLESPVEFSALPEAAPNPVALREGESLIGRIRRRGVLRFGYDAAEERMPFCFVNSAGQAVGYDIEMMHLLARTLNVRLELVSTTRQTLGAQAAEDHFDLAGCGFSLTSARSAAFNLSAPYLDLHAAFVVSDYRRHDLDSLAKLAERHTLTIGAATDQDYVAAAGLSIPQAKIVRLDRLEDFFEGRRPKIHSLFTNAETGSAMTLLHPTYSVVIPNDMKIALPTVFVLSRNDAATKQLLNDWILLRQKNGQLDRLYDHWILGKTAERRGPHWSVIRNVLGWVREP
jgi:ABC-type amino acid transport substrate-binding protein